MLLDMLECTTGLRKCHAGAEGTNELVYDGVPGVEGLEHLSWYGVILVDPLLTIEYRTESVEVLVVDG
jgi:hypothetical protein